MKIKEITSGKVYKITNLKQFCLLNGLSYSSLKEVIRGERWRHKDWCLPATKININYYLVYNIKTQKPVIANSIRELSKKTKLGVRSLCNLIDGITFQVKNYILPENRRHGKTA